MDPYEEEQLAKEKAMAVAELREAMEQGIKRGWFYAKLDESGEGLRLDGGR